VIDGQDKGLLVDKGTPGHDARPIDGEGSLRAVWQAEITLTEMNNTRKARKIIAEARDLLGGNGILLGFHVMRHLADIEAIHTYDGTETIRTLIVGRTSLVPAPLPDGRTIRFVDIHADRVRLRTAVHDSAGRCC
jgi:alkylation response protein AidB-like acyl-CoA dehydrogenase